MMTDPRTNAQALAGLFDTDMLMSDEFSRKKRKAVVDPDATTGLLQMPKTPMQQLVEEDGALKTTGKMMLNVLTGGLLSPLIHPELMGKKDQYESDMKLYQKAREMAMVDPQDQALADAILEGKTGPELMALQAVAGGVDKLNMDQATLSPGQIRYDSLGNVVATGGAPVVQPGDIERRASAFAQGYGIEPGTRAYSDVVAAFSEPTHTKELPDGTTQVYNTIDLVKENIANGVYEGIGPRASAGVNTTSSQGVSPRDVEIANLRKQAMEWDNEKQGEAEEKGIFYSRLTEQMNKMGKYDPRTGQFIANDAVRDIYGSIDSKYPTWARGDDERMAQALVDQIVEILAVDERGKLKGQGQITEGETKMLRDSLTILTNMGIGDEDMQTEIARLYRNVLEQQDKSANYRSRNPYRKQLEAMADGLPDGFEVDK